jgi:uncharacterized protein HemX
MTWLLALLRPYLTYLLIALGATIGAAGFYGYAWLQGQHAAQVRGLQERLQGLQELLKLREEIVREDRRRAQEAERELEELKAKAQEMTDAMAKDPNSNVECFSAADVDRLRQLFTPRD